MLEEKKIEQVIETFAEFIDATSDIDVAKTRKNGYVLLVDGMCSEPIRTGREMCEALLHELEIDFRIVKDLGRGEIPQKLRPELYSRIYKFLNKLPEYQDLLENEQ